MNASGLIKKNLLASVAAKHLFLSQENEILNFEKAACALANAYKIGGRLYIAGNGGSAADAQHLAAEFVSKLSVDRMPLAAEALTVDSSILTAIGNDYGYEMIFARQIAGKMTEKDIFLGITTSGKSENILMALKECRRKNIKSILFTGRDGGPATRLADYAVLACGDTTAVIQELHIVLAHSLCEYVENEIFNR